MIRLRALVGRLSITARITLGSLVVAVLIGVVAVIGIRIGVNAILDNTTLTLLRHDAEPFQQQVKNDPTDIDATPGEGQYVAIISPTGDVRMTTLPKSLRPFGNVALSSEETITRVSTSQREYVVRSEPVPTSSGLWHVVTARNEDTNQLVLNRLSLALVIGGAVLVACFTLASYILARAALRPVNAMRRQADQLARRQSGTGGAITGYDAGLLEVPPVHDELAALAITLNGLIEGLRRSADREKQLVSDASHELRTPLAVLRGELELAELDSGDADALLGDVRQAQQTVLRLSALATNLLELSRIEAHQGRGAATWSELGDELASAIDRMRLASSVRGIECVIDFEVEQGEAPESVALSTQEFGRVVDNLISNAINAIGVSKGAGTITATLSRQPGSIELAIVDDGPGIPADFLPIALDRFTRVDQARATSTGSGLGLAIVGALVDAAHGTLQMAPAPTGGLSVTISLPLTVPLAVPQHPTV